MLDFQHRSGMDMMDTALGTIGRRLQVTAAATANEAVVVIGDETGAPTTSKE